MGRMYGPIVPAVPHGSMDRPQQRPLTGDIKSEGSWADWTQAIGPPLAFSNWGEIFKNSLGLNSLGHAICVLKLGDGRNWGVHDCTQTVSTLAIGSANSNINKHGKDRTECPLPLW